MKIGVIPNLDKHGVAKIVSDIGIILQSYKMQPILPSSIEYFDNPCYKSMDDNKLYKYCDIILTVGGDGTLIHAAKKAAAENKPILGVNAGRVGFLAGLESNELQKLELLKSGVYTIEKRMLLKVKIFGINNDKTYYSLNDAVISKGIISRIIDITVECGGDTICYRADGLIAATPTGSTGYSMSAGGPVLDPSIESIIITPICPYLLFTRSLILNSNTVVKIAATGQSGTSAYLTIDGEEAIELYDDCYVEVSKANDRTVKLIKLKDDSFYKIIGRKL